MTDRPAVDVVVPFAGSDRALDEVLARLAALRRGPGDTVVVADNRPRARRREAPGALVLPAGDRRGSYHARNAGAAHGSAPWLLFLDGDVEPPPDLLDRLFEPAPR